MSNNIELSTNGWDRTLLNLSSITAEPFCMTWHLLRFRLVAPLDPTKFENCNNRVAEVAVRSLIVAGAVLSGTFTYQMPVFALGSLGTLGAMNRLFRSIGFAVQKGGYTHVHGNAAEKEINDSSLKVMNWNVCGIGGGLSLDHGGVVHWRSRLDALVDKILEEDPDVLVLEEIYDTALGEALIEKLRDEYAHFFMHLGPNVMGSVGGGMVLSKCAVHSFSNTSFTINPWTINRGFATLEVKAKPSDALPFARIIGTHLFHRAEDTALRAKQMQQIADAVKNSVLKMTTVLTGDLNIERDGEEGETLNKYLKHGYQDGKPTATNQMVSQWDYRIHATWGEMIDYISLFQDRWDGKTISSIQSGASLTNCRLVQAFDETYDTQTALSDHHGVIANLTGLREAEHLKRA